MRQCGHREGTCAWSTINPPSYANREVLSRQSCLFCLASSPRTLAAAAAQACCQREPALHVGADESDACLSRACLLISGAPITHTLVLCMVPFPFSLPFLQPVCDCVEGGASGSDTGVGEHMAGRAPAPHASCRQQSSQDADAAKSRHAGRQRRALGCWE